MKSRKLFFIILVSSAFGQNVVEEIFDDIYQPESSIGCQMFINNQTGSPQPLYIRPGSDKFLHPNNRNRILTLTSGQEVEMFCAEYNNPAGVRGLIRVSCVSGSTVQYLSTLLDFSSITCRARPTSVALRRTSGTTRCFNNAIFVDIGFSLPDGRFVRTFTSCHDEVLGRNHYTYYVLEPHTDGNQQGLNRPAWRQAGFFPGMDVDNLQSVDVQRQTLATILGSTEQALRFIPNPPGNNFMARGHMAAMTDFVYSNEQFSTFFFINTAPQWQGFNSLNWLSVEDGTRQLAADRGIVLDTYTGTFGVTQLWNEAGIWFSIYLHYNATTGARSLPVPMLYYKIIVNKANNSGVVFLGVNNPHLTLTNIQNSGYIICDDVSSRITYIPWQKDSLSRGYSYACEVNDFLRRVPHVTGLTVTSLLI
jgi:DNA/RNA non-specific endonuclease